MNAARIERIMDELRGICRRDPDSRFLELLASLAYPDDRLSFFSEDETLEARIKAQCYILFGGPGRLPDLRDRRHDAALARPSSRPLSGSVQKVRSGDH
jgi:hypothetical protein